MIQAAEIIVAEIRRVTSLHAQPIVVALDGGSGAGKSTLSVTVQGQTGAALVVLDDFYTTDVPEVEWSQRSIEQRLRDVFDWERVRHDAIEPLRTGRPAWWQAFDFEAGLGPKGTYRLKREFTEVPPAPVILLAGSYSASPPLADLIDLSVLVDVPVHERHRRMAVRDQAVFLKQWHAIWDDVESYYFNHVCPPDSFDLVVPNNRLQRDRGPRAALREREKIRLGRGG